MIPRPGDSVIPVDNFVDKLWMRLCITFSALSLKTIGANWHNEVPPLRNNL